MLLDENAPERRMSEAHLPVDFPRFDPMPTQGIAPELVTGSLNPKAYFILRGGIGLTPRP
jgi:hypothetical protein